MHVHISHTHARTHIECYYMQVHVCIRAHAYIYIYIYIYIHTYICTYIHILTHTHTHIYHRAEFTRIDWLGVTGERTLLKFGIIENAEYEVRPEPKGLEGPMSAVFANSFGAHRG